MPGKKSIHTQKWDRCVKSVEKQGKDKSSAAAICSSSIEDAGVKKEHQRKSGKGYYANRKKAEKKNEMCINFNDFVNEHWSDPGFDQSAHIDDEYWYKLKELTDRYMEDYGTEGELWFIEKWLFDNDEPEFFASGILKEINK
jgi:hypothetical protein